MGTEVYGSLVPPLTVTLLGECVADSQLGSVTRVKVKYLTKSITEAGGDDL
jgi:hypothetical protein